jgi:NAD(P)H-flavin reductase/ferredoxin
MFKVEFSGQELTLLAGESVLDGLLRHGIPVPHSCKAGVCHSCMMQAPNQTVPARAQAGLKDSLKAQGYFLACVCHPQNMLSIRTPGADAQVHATIASVSPLSDTVVRVRLAISSQLEYRAGQFVTLLREDGLARSYSLASLPAEGALELHVRKVQGGAMSSWLYDDARAQTTMRIQGPSGQCFYIPGNPDQPLLLAGTGTGLAPLYGIVRDALSQGHKGPIRLFHGAVDPSGLYLVDELRALSRRHAHVEYVPSVLKIGPAAADAFPMEVGALDATVLSRCPSLQGWKGYLCGDPALVNQLRKKLFIAGMPSRHIYADPFVPSAATEAAVG